MQINEKDISICVSLAYKELRRLGDVLHVPMRDTDVELVRDEALKVYKAIFITNKKINQLIKK